MGGRGEKLYAVMCRNAMAAENKAGGKLTNHVSTKAYKANIRKFCAFAEKKGIVRQGHIERAGYSAQTLLQEYADKLKEQGYSAQTIHSYLAPACKGLGVGMHQISMPKRMSAAMSKNTLRRQNAVGEAQRDDPRFQRIVQFAAVVTVRPQAMVRLTADNLVTDDSGDTLISVRDKGGKLSQQLVLPHEVEFVRYTLTHDAEGRPLAAGEKPFSRKDLGKIAYSGFRCRRAQELELHFEKLFNGWKSMPSRTPQQRMERQHAAELAAARRQEWVDKICRKWNESHPKTTESQRNAYRARLEKPSRIFIRGGNLEQAEALGRPVSYDRVACRIVSVYALSHWEDESTIRNYLTK